jgi:hypothetical protein
MQQAGMLGGPGRWIDTEDGKLHKAPAIDPTLPWIQVNVNPDLHCQMYLGMVNAYGFIPQKCLDCWKIVVAPRTFHELMQLLDLQESMVKENPNCWCKCGVEERDTVPRNFGGYFYTRSLEQGLVRKKTVREKVSEAISPEVPVILKRYCTEYELRFGPSDEYVRPKGADEIEKQFWENVQLTTESVPQPEFVRKNIIHQWMIFAHGRGDPTVKDYNMGQPLFPPYVTYHDKE